MGNNGQKLTWERKNNRKLKDYIFLLENNNYKNFHNNFLHILTDICRAGQPLKDLNQILIKCGSSAVSSGVCPANFACTSDGYCCLSSGKLEFLE